MRYLKKSTLSETSAVTFFKGTTFCSDFYTKEYTSFLCNANLRCIKTRPQFSMFAIYLLSERSERKIYIENFGNVGLLLISRIFAWYMNFYFIVYFTKNQQSESFITPRSSHCIQTNRVTRYFVSKVAKKFLKNATIGEKIQTKKSIW